MVCRDETWREFVADERTTSRSLAHGALIRYKFGLQCNDRYDACFVIYARDSRAAHSQQHASGGAYPKWCLHHRQRGTVGTVRDQAQHTGKRRASPENCPALAASSAPAEVRRNLCVPRRSAAILLSIAAAVGLAACESTSGRGASAIAVEVEAATVCKLGFCMGRNVPDGTVGNILFGGRAVALS